MFKRILIVITVISFAVLLAALLPAPIPKAAKVIAKNDLIQSKNLSVGVQESSNNLVKVNAAGEAIGEWQGPWTCVYDKNTGLLWEVKSYREDMHDGMCSFSWFDPLLPSAPEGSKSEPDRYDYYNPDPDGKTGLGLGEAKRGFCFTENQIADTSDLIQSSNEDSYCGVSTWRLPTAAELESLIIDNPEPGEPAFAKDFFPYSRRGSYWTADTGQALTGYYEYLQEGATSLYFGKGEQEALPYKSTALVRLVSADW